MGLKAVKVPGLRGRSAVDSEAVYASFQSKFRTILNVMGLNDKLSHVRDGERITIVQEQEGQRMAWCYSDTKDSLTIAQADQAAECMLNLLSAFRENGGQLVREDSEELAPTSKVA